MDKISRFFSKNELARLLLEKYQKDEIREVTLKQVEDLVAQEHLSEERSDIIKTVREMERLQLIDFIVGRRGKVSRILWKIESKANMAHEEPEVNSTLPAVQTPVALPVYPIEVPIQALQPSNLLNHTFHLRSDLSVSLSLPKDLTEHEADRVAAFIKTLPFDFKPHGSF